MKYILISLILMIPAQALLAIQRITHDQGFLGWVCVLTAVAIIVVQAVLLIVGVVSFRRSLR